MIYKVILEHSNLEKWEKTIEKPCFFAWFIRRWLSKLLIYIVNIVVAQQQSVNPQPSKKEGDQHI